MCLNDHGDCIWNPSYKNAQKYTYINLIDEGYFQDEVNNDMQFTVLNDRAQGGSSIKDGEIELMVRNVIVFIVYFLSCKETKNEKQNDKKNIVFNF